MAISLSLYAELAGTEVLGSGRRYAIWVQGCPMDCPGCMTQAARSFLGGYQVTVDDLAARILAEGGIDGLTLSGGEPFAQAAALAALVQRVREERDLGVMVYSGYTLAELRKLAAGDAKGVSALLAAVDVLVDGRYQVRRDDGGRWRGSANQRAHCLTPRYREAMAQEFGRVGRKVELHIRQSEWLLAGVPGREALAQWRRMTEKDKGL